MDNLLLILIFAILALYFFSSTSVYKSLYKKIKLEKDSTNDVKNSREKEIEKYEKRLKNAILTIQDTEVLLNKSRDEVQKLRHSNSELKRRNDLLQERVDELYSSVGMI
jgi:TolA-binding protein